MRKASTRRSDARARVRSAGRILMTASYLEFWSRYKEHFSVPCPRREDVVKGSNAICRRVLMLD